MSFFTKSNKTDEQIILPEKDNLIEDLFTEIKNRVTSGVVNSSHRVNLVSNIFKP